MSLKYNNQLGSSNLQYQNSKVHEDRDQLHYQMVSNAFKKRRQNGELQTVQQIYSRLPLPRLQKDHYSFLFQTIKSNIQQILSKQNILQKIQLNQQQQINKIQVKTFRDIQFAKQLQPYQQKLKSGAPIFKSIVYIRSQDAKIFQQHEGQKFPFLPDQKYIDLKTITQQITHTRVFLQNTKPLREYQFQFLDENIIQLKTRGFPTTYEIQKRAETLAKLYILNMFRQQSRKMKQLNKMDQDQLNHQRQIKKIKQQLEIEKLKQGELIEEMDLIKQVHKILVLIQKKMNQMAYDQFSIKKNGQRARQIKRSLEKLKDTLAQESSARIKLRMLIAYKHKKGW